MAFLLSELAWRHGLLAEPVCLEELVWRRVRPLPAAGSSVLAEADAAGGRPRGSPDVPQMMRWLLQQQTAAGGAIKNLKLAPDANCRWQEIEVRLFNWGTVLPIPWREVDHINLAESRAHDLSVRMRTRHRSQHGCKFIQYWTRS